MFDILFRGGKVVTAEGVFEADVAVTGEKIACIGKIDASAASKKVTTRKKSEKNMEDYNKLVVEDEEQEKQYKSEYRGKVQNRNTETTLQPMYVLTYYEEENKLKQAINYCRDVEKVNGRKILPEKALPWKC